MTYHVKQPADVETLQAIQKTLAAIHKELVEMRRSMEWLATEAANRL